MTRTPSVSVVDRCWKEVEDLGRCVDRELECVRAMLGWSDSAVDSATASSLVRDIASDAAERWAALDRWICTRDEGGGESPRDETSIVAVSHAVARCFHSIARLGAWAIPEVPDRGPEPIDDVVRVLADDVTDRYRVLLDAWAGRSAKPAGGDSISRVPVELYVDRILDLTASHADERSSLPAWKATVAWTAIAGQVAEATTCLSFWHEAVHV